MVSDGSYGVPEGLVAGLPVTSHGPLPDREDLPIDERGRDGIERSVSELLAERDVVIKHGLVPAI